MRPVTQHVLFAFLASALLAACTGGGTGTTPTTPVEVPVAFVPDTVTLTPGGQAELLITGGRRPFTVSVDNPAAVTLQANLDDLKVRVIANETGVESIGRITVRDAVNSTATATATVKPNVITSTITFESLPAAGGDATVSRCQDGTTLCAGSLARVTIEVTNTGGGVAGRPIRFDVIQGQFGFTTDAAFTQVASTITVPTDASGTASVVIRANADAFTQPATLRATDTLTGAQRSAAFTIGGRALAVLPTRVTLIGPRRGVCGSGQAAFQIFGGRPPYAVTSAATFISVTTPVVMASGGTATVGISQPSACAGLTGTVTVMDAQSSVVTATVEVQEGTATSPALSVSPTSLTINRCASRASAVFTGTPTAIAYPPELSVQVGSGVITVAPAQGAVSGTYVVSLTDGNSSASLTVTLSGLPPTGCP